MVNMINLQLKIKIAISFLAVSNNSLILMAGADRLSPFNLWLWNTILILQSLFAFIVVFQEVIIFHFVVLIAFLAIKFNQ